MSALRVLVAGGGTAGHVEPALSLADALRRRDPATHVTALGTETGLEARLVPARGYDLALIPRVPLPRKPSGAWVTLPKRLKAAVDAAGAAIERSDAQVVVGFGGYVALPAYLAARRRKIPVVVHEANMKPGVANRIGARFAAQVATAFEGTQLTGARVVGMPLRTSITHLDRVASRQEAREFFGLDPDRPTLFVFGGSQGAARLNASIPACASDVAEAGAQVLHVTGLGRSVEVPAHAAAHFHQVEYVDRMDLAYAAADLVVGRAGAMTCAELAAVGLPAVFVPLPIGNGEQRLNAGPLVEAGAGLIIDDAAFTPEVVRARVVPLLVDAERLERMGSAMAAQGHRDADERLADMVEQAVKDAA